MAAQGTFGALPIDWTLTETPFLGQNGLFVLTLHPYLSGHRAPMQIAR